MSGNISLVLLSLVFVVPSGSASAQAPDCLDSDEWIAAVRGKSREECEKSAGSFSKTCAQDELTSTAATVNRVGAELGCFNKVLDAELDKRLLPLKSRDAAQFKIEMKLQKSFKVAVRSACDALNSCDGTMYRITRMDCLRSATVWRLQQAVDLNHQRLVLKRAKRTTQGAESKLEKNSALAEFSRLFCRLPKEVFADKVRPVDCEEEIRSEFISTLGSSCP